MTLQNVNKRCHWLCHAYCLMDNHYHLLSETPDGNLSIGICDLIAFARRTPLLTPWKVQPTFSLIFSSIHTIMRLLKQLFGN